MSIQEISVRLRIVSCRLYPSVWYICIKKKEADFWSSTRLALLAAPCYSEHANAMTCHGIPISHHVDAVYIFASSCPTSHRGDVSHLSPDDVKEDKEKRGGGGGRRIPSQPAPAPKNRSHITSNYSLKAVCYPFRLTHTRTHTHTHKHTSDLLPRVVFPDGPQPAATARAPSLDVGDGALQRARQVDVEQRPVGAVHRDRPALS